MESAVYSRSETIKFLKEFLTAWAGNSAEKLKGFFAHRINLRSNVHGEVEGKEEVSKSLLTDGLKYPLELSSSNHFMGLVTGEEDKIVLTFYLYGNSKDQRMDVTTFGASCVMEVLIDPSGDLKIGEFIVSVNWIQGDAHLFYHWNLLRGQRFWQPGDASAILVSELDAPWNKYGEIKPIGNLEDIVAEAYARYAWAIDQNDVGLLATAFTNDAQGNLTPMGDLNGLHNIVGQIKDFRQPWPWMQHFGEPVGVRLSENEDRAYLIIGRIVPQYTETVKGEKTYVAFYPLTLTRVEGHWKIDRFNYIPYNFQRLEDLKHLRSTFLELSKVLTDKY